MLRRFLAEIEDATRATLSGDEARHARTVLRLGVGDLVAVFDGRGREWRARIDECSKSAVRVQLLEPISPAREPRVPVTLLQSVLKGDHMDAVVRDAVMAGVRTIVPVLSAHTVASTRAASGERARDRWRRVALASAKQCRRSTLPEVAAAKPLPEALRLEDGAPAGRLRAVLVEPSASRPAALASDLPRPDALVLAVGPEGGWADDELSAIGDAGFVAVSLGPLTLRADAAALVAISMLRSVWNDL